MIRLILAGAVLGAAAGAAHGQAPMAVVDSTFDSQGVRIHYVISGPSSGVPVVLIHGFSANNSMWDGVRVALANRYRVIAMDCRGHGASGKPHEPSAYGIEMVNDVTRLLDHLKIARAHVVGYSMGGSIALKLLETHPERLLSVTSGGSAGFRVNDTTEQWDSAFVKKLVAGEPLSQAMIEAAPPGMPAPSTEQRAMMARMDSVQDSRALGAQRLGNPGLYVDYAKLGSRHVPTLLIVGEQDNPGRFAELRAATPAAEFVVVPGARHGSVPMTQEFLAGLRSFLQRHDHR